MVRCDVPLLPYIVCENNEFDSSRRYQDEDYLLVCCPSVVKQKKWCFHFIWFQKNTPILPRPAKCKVAIWTRGDFMQFQFLFDALSGQLPLITPDGNNFRATRYLNEYYVEKSNSSVEGYQTWKKATTKLRISLIQNVLRCPDGSFVSIILLGDKKHQCTFNEVWKNNGVKTIEMQKGSSISFLDLSMKNTKHLNQLCSEEKQHSNGKHLLCHKGPQKIPFQVSDICQYRLDKNKHLYPCKFGDHLESCESFACNLMFKCPKSYCIPWTYTCNGQWECPFGLDETMVCPTHETKRNCSQMFKCAGTSVCIHVGSVCDGLLDCKEYDDELFCMLSTVRCPQSCTCLGFVLVCETLAQITNKLPSTHLFFYSPTITSLERIVWAFESVKSFVLTSSPIVKICQKFIAYESIQLVNISHNLVPVLSSNCFSYFDNLSVISLEMNGIKALHKCSFTHLPKLSLLNLSSNLLTILEADFLHNISSHVTMSLFNISITTVSHHLHVFKDLPARTIQTDTNEICCIANEKVICSAEQPWYAPCAHFIGKNTLLKILCIVLSQLVLWPNVLALFYHFCHSEKRERTTGAQILLVAENLVGILLGVFLTAIWILHVVSSTFLFINQQLSTYKAICFLSSFLLLFFCWFSAVLSMLLAISRWSVVVHPFDSKFKQTTFMKRCITSAFMSILPFVILSAVWILLLEPYISNGLCTPFVDPGSQSTFLKLLNILSLLLHATNLCVAISMHSSLAVKLRHSDQSSMLNTPSTKLTKALAVQLVLKPLFVMMSWIPADIIFVVIQFISPFPLVLVFWATIVVIPINSVGNHILEVGKFLRKL